MSESIASLISRHGTFQGTNSQPSRAAHGHVAAIIVHITHRFSQHSPSHTTSQQNHNEMYHWYSQRRLSQPASLKVDHSGSSAAWRCCIAAPVFPPQVNPRVLNCRPVRRVCATGVFVKNLWIRRVLERLDSAAGIGAVLLQLNLSASLSTYCLVRKS